VAQALLPALTAGLALGVMFMISDVDDEFTLLLVLVWTLFYGCAIHAAGFFMPRGIKLFGWLFIGGACGFFALLLVTQPDPAINPNWIMGFFFGLLHLVYGVYLFLTEKRKNVA
jgi:hypothetical protein